MQMDRKPVSGSVSGRKGKGEKGATSSVSAADYETTSTAGALSTRAPTSSYGGDDHDSLTHVGGATHVSGSTDDRMALNDRYADVRSDRMGLDARQRNQGRKKAAGRAGGDPSDDGGDSGDESSSGQGDEGDEDYQAPDDSDSDDDDEYESLGSGGDRLSDSTFKPPKTASKAAQSATPVHQSAVQGVWFDEPRHVWIAHVRVGGERKKKKFGVSKYGGRDEARRAAEECRLQNDKDNEKAGRHIKSRSKSEITGVGRDNTTARWGSSWYENGKQKKECFSVAGVGEEGAKQEAIKRRQLMETTATGLDRKDQELVDQLAAKNVKGVHFDERQNRWVASWREGGKLHSKTFAINKHGGIEEAYDKAVACRREKEASGAAGLKQPAEIQSGHKGVSWHKAGKAWVAQWSGASGEQQQRYFSLFAYEGNSEEAKADAIRWRKTMVEQTKREKRDRLVDGADRQVPSRKRPSEAPEGRRVRRKATK
ncbi:unnamed protein product [Vitrella brassicaformis CCMP3155]|uniref:AP2/ERF domain-containing protein n=2 Tax=Vitrella brassicaformis TaxID=1169539 RepID=A0A0G4GE76_VITBC|nr:unnamed protein product [Vitrella brassicaformis CCMP3155]|eukprot:CEM27726.1 unnamed protein product [Vitrella brassicaformis CCMP3155]